jgi:nucleoside-diphosphate-sugar epimerase
MALGIVAALTGRNLGEIHNIDSGIGTDNREIIEQISGLARSAGFLVKMDVLTGRCFDVSVSLLGSTKLRTRTGWEPVENSENRPKKVWSLNINARAGQR